MEFKDFPYERPDLEHATKECERVVSILNTSNDYEEALKAVKEYYSLRENIQTMVELASVRYSINTYDEFYEAERNYFDEYGASYEELDNRFARAIINTKHQPELEKYFGKRLFDIIRVTLETFSVEIMPELQEEAKLVSQYQKLIASAKISFDGKILNLAQLGPYKVSSNREMRKNAERAGSMFFEENIDQFDEIYDKLVSVRNRMAKKLGFDNFIKLGYKRLGRTDYTDNDVKGYREEIYKEIVPLVKKLYDKQAEIIGIKDLRSYDLGFMFPNGNPKPIGDVNDKINNAIKMYHEMSPETKEFVDFMFKHNLVDLEAKSGKLGGGYCTFFPLYKAPFVFSNFNGTSDDVEVLTHEFGHAFQVYSSRDTEVLEYLWPTMESAEIHSTSMEFFSSPWMKYFFGDDDVKYQYAHLVKSITFIPYGVLVDEFQHEVYAHPEMSISDRKAVWRELEKKYLPSKVYDDPFLDQGNWWYKQSHIFVDPFYYIDYTLAHNCAHQYWIKNRYSHEEAWNDYYKLCCEGGKKSFFGLLKVGNLENPFTKGTVKKVTAELTKWLDDFDIRRLK